MSSEITLHKFTGWAIVELMGHSREAGYVTTEYFGTAHAMFSVKTPGLPAVDKVLEREDYFCGLRCDPGTTIRKPEVKPRERLIGAGAVYAINPATESEVMEHVERFHEYDPPEIVKRVCAGPDKEEDNIPF